LSSILPIITRPLAPLGPVRRDEAAICAGLTQRWNQGMVEGKVNKLIKRKLYGRANFDLLRAMVLAAEAEGL